MINKHVLSVFCTLFLVTSLFAHGDLHEQIKRLSLAIQQTPSNAKLYLQRGQLYTKHDNFEAAKQDYLTARKLDKKLLITDLLLSKMFSQQHKVKLALKHINIFLEQHPQHTNALTVRANIFKQKGQMTACQADLEKALAHLVQPHPSHFVEMSEAVLLADASNVSAALTWLQKGQVHFGFDIVLKEKEVDLYLQSRAYQKALTAIDDILKQFPRKEKWLFKKATIYEMSHQIDLAKTHYTATLAAIQTLPKRLQHSSKILELEAKTLEKINLLN